MIILRKPPYETFVQYSLDPSTAYRIIIKDSDRDTTVFDDTRTSDAEGLLSIGWSEFFGTDGYHDFSKYDEEYSLEIMDVSDTVVQDTLTVERPYVDPELIAKTEEDIEQAKYNERLARAIIDSITGGFYFKETWVETTGQGTDYIPIWERIYKILKAYENTELVYDSSDPTPALGDWNYVITKDKTAITKDPLGAVLRMNRAESAPVGVNIAYSDSISMFDTADSGNTLALKAGVLFNSGTDYIFLLETGYKVVPHDIQDAAKMLINDLECGKLEYFKSYITEYSTDQFKIKIDSSALSGTGNILVDKILDKYINNVKRPGLL